MRIFSRFNRARLRERRWLLWPMMMLLTVTLAGQGCSYVKSLWSSGDDTADLDDAATANEGEPLPPPVANVAVSYKRPGDALARATVIKFFGADVIANHPRDAAHTESVVRFDGGVPIWAFKADESTFGSITGVGAGKYALKNIEYAKVPAHFTQVIPEEGPPELCVPDRSAVGLDQLPGRESSRRWFSAGVQRSAARGQQLPALLQYRD